MRNRPHKNAVQSLERVLAIHSKYWTSLKRTQTHVQYSVLEAKLREKEEAETVSALTSLSLQVVADSASKYVVVVIVVVVSFPAIVVVVVVVVTVTAISGTAEQRSHSC